MTSAYRDYGWDDRLDEGTACIFPVLAGMLERDRGKRILDLGCGNGAIASMLIDRGFDVWGVDASASGVANANKRHPGRFFVQDLSEPNLPEAIASQTFDLAISTEVIEHLYAPRTYLQTIHKVLEARRGDLILSTPYHGYAKNLVLAATNRMDAHFSALWDGGHIKFWSRRTLSQLLEEQGFTVVDFRGVGRVRWLWKSMLVRATLGSRRA